MNAIRTTSLNTALPPRAVTTSLAEPSLAPADTVDRAAENEDVFHVMKCGLAGLAALTTAVAVASPAHALPEPPTVGMSVTPDVGAKVVQVTAWPRADFHTPFVTSSEIRATLPLPTADGFPVRAVTDLTLRMAANDDAWNVFTPLHAVEDVGARLVLRAASFVGQRSAALLGRLPFFKAAGGASNNCADFVSAILQSEGILRVHHTYVPNLEHQLRHDGWVRVPAAKAQPGDVWFSPDRGHVEIVAKPGGQTLIGSNNNGRHYQTISHGSPYGGGAYYQRNANR